MSTLSASFRENLSSGMIQKSVRKELAHTTVMGKEDCYVCLGALGVIVNILCSIGAF